MRDTCKQRTSNIVAVMTRLGRLLLAVAFLFVAFPGQGQKLISGYVLEFTSNKTIPEGASLALKDSTFFPDPIQKKTNKYNGYFELTIDEKYDSLIVFKPGYVTRVVPISDRSGTIATDELRLQRQINMDMELNERRVTVGLTILRKVYLQDGTDTTYVLLTPRQPLQEIEITQQVNAVADTLVIAHEAYYAKKISLLRLFDQLSAVERSQYSPSFELEPIVKPFYDRGISTAGKRNQSLSEIPASVVLITQEEIKAQGYQTVADVLENVTGLYLFRDYSWSGGDPILGMRGFFSAGFNDDLIILVNGVNQYQDYWGFYPFASFPIPVEAIDRIEIVRGPMSVLYGSGAFFGAINIITNGASKELRDDETYPKFLNASYGSRDTRRISGGFEFNKEKVNFSFNGQLLNTDGLDQPFTRFLNDSVNTTETTAGKLPLTQRYINISLNVKDRTEQIQTNLEVVNSTESRGIFESTVSSSNGFCRCPIPQANPDAAGSINRTSSSYGALMINFNPSRTNVNYGARINFYQFQTSIDYNTGGNRFGLSSFLSRAFEGEVSASNDWEQLGLSGIVGLNARRAEDLQTTFDIPSASFIDGNNYIALDNDSDLTLYSAFGEFSYALIKDRTNLSSTGLPTAKLAFTAGLRLEDLSDFSYQQNQSLDTLNNLAITPNTTTLSDLDPVVIPRAALVYTIDRYNHVKFLYGQARKRPSFGNYTDNGELRFPTIQTLELNFIREDKKVESDDVLKVRLNASIFYNQIDDLITRVSTVDNEGNSVFQSGNEQSVNTLGTELGLFLNYRRWNLEISGSLNRSQEDQTLSSTVVISGQTPSYSPFFLGYLKASYVWQLKSMDVIAGFNTRYISEVDPGFALDANNNPQRIGQDVPGYMIANANIRLNGSSLKADTDRNWLRNFFLAINVRNMFDADLQYPTTGNNSAWAEKGSPGFGRRFQFSIGLDM